MVLNLPITCGGILSKGRLSLARVRTATIAHNVLRQQVREFCIKRKTQLNRLCARVHTFDAQW